MNSRIEARDVTARGGRIVAGILLLGSLFLGAPARAEQEWGPLSFLIGDWVGEGEGKPGSGGGEFTFQPDLGGQVLVRKSRADYPAAKDRPAVHHSDLMVLYRDGANTASRAIYFDNEGHVIRYAVRTSAAGDTLEFLSEPDPAAPAYRLRYIKTGPATAGVTFDVAPPGRPAEFTQYLSGACKRRP